jgi:hypothetical protein
VVLDEDVHEDLDIREGGYEGLRDARYWGRFPAVDGDRPACDVVGGNASRVATASRLGVLPCELFNLLPIVGHLYATLDRAHGQSDFACARVLPPDSTRRPLRLVTRAGGRSKAGVTRSGSGHQTGPKFVRSSARSWCDARADSVGVTVT